MKGWLESVVGPDYAAALMWTIVALIVLLVLLIVIRIARGLSVGTFVAGGRNRKTRLAVMDATAVDSHRRLVLVRRDDVEHLILIGGPTDVVVEQNIRLIASTRRLPDEEAHPRNGHAPEPPAVQPRHQPHAEPAPRPAPPAPPRPVVAPTAPVAAPPPAPASPAARTEPRFQHATPVAPPTPPRPAYAPASAPTVPPMRPVDAPPRVTAPTPPVHAAASAPRKADIDEALLQELEVSLDSEPLAPAPAHQPPAAKSAVDSTLDEEMSKLLSDLAGKR